MPVLILLLATVYLLTIYLLLTVVQRNQKIAPTPPSNVGQTTSVR